MTWEFWLWITYGVAIALYVGFHLIDKFFLEYEREKRRRKMADDMNYYIRASKLKRLCMYDSLSMIGESPWGDIH